MLDNLETVTPESLQKLLDAAVLWSEAGGSRVLCTTRISEFKHKDYRIKGTRIHRRIQLDGLGTKEFPDDALEWFAVLRKLPPEPTIPPPDRVGLVYLFDQIKFHPLSIRVLSQELKTRRIANVGSRLENLLSISPQFASYDVQSLIDEDTPAWLLASLELSLDRLDAAARQALPRLGVFQGGAFEDDLCAITGLGDPYAEHRQQCTDFLAAVEGGKAEECFQAMGKALPDDAQLREFVDAFRAQLAELPPAPPADIWPGLRQQLEAAALIETENIPSVGVPFLRFHPTLAPMLWARLSAAERERLRDVHWRRYYALSGDLYREDSQNPHQVRDIAWRELPNLLQAVHAALDAGAPDAADFADNVNLFLRYFGLKQEEAILAAKVQDAAGGGGSQAWFLAQSNRGERLCTEGRSLEATKVFQDILVQLGNGPSYNRAITLGRLGRCFRSSGRPDWAATQYREALNSLEALSQSDDVLRQRGGWLTDLATLFTEQEQFAEARQVYLDALKIFEDLKELREQGVVQGLLGILALQENDLTESAKRHHAALALFHKLREPEMEAVAWCQLGIVYQEAQQWDEAERHYHESARIDEELGNLANAAMCWNYLAILWENAGKPDVAEMWYRKAIDIGQQTSDRVNLSKYLSNLGDLLQTNYPKRLPEARKLAEEALVIKQTLAPGAAEIWQTYTILAEIAEQEALAASDPILQAKLQAEASDRRRLAREARRNYAGTRHELRQQAPLIFDVIASVQEPKIRQELEQALSGLEERGWTNLVAAIRRILAGERDADALCDKLDLEDSMIVEAILSGLTDPATLSDLLPTESEEQPDDPPQEE
ncbi:TPA: hypothetical protein DDW35_09980 [Candidatus Sumerlaeota bacterium]|nr:hypothetical protein [Candidatus Sumerlaeota bacterium]